MREVNLSDPELGYFASYNGSNQDPAHGLLVLRIDADQLRAEFVPASGATFTDTFTITGRPSSR